MTNFELLIKCDPDLMPTIGNPGDAGYDLRSAAEATVAARSRATINTGVSIALPAGYVALVHPRSGLVNHSDEDFEIARGDRVAQIVFQKFESATFFQVSELPASHRGNAGFGSTGVK
jgi:dUTP pyrophosphatase